MRSPVHREPDHSSREGLVVEVFAPDIPNRRRSHSGRRMEERHDRALRRIATHLEPGVAGHVPIELVEFVEEAEHPRCAVSDVVDVRTGFDECIGAADPNSRAVRDRLYRVGLDTTVPTYLENIEPHVNRKAVAVAVA